MKRIKYLEKPTGLVIPGIKGVAPHSSVGIGKQLDDGTVLTSMELDESGVVYFRKTTKDGQPSPVKLRCGDRVYEAPASCMHASKLGGFLLDDDEQPARPAQQQGQQRR